MSRVGDPLTTLYAAFNRRMDTLLTKNDDLFKAYSFLRLPLASALLWKLRVNNLTSRWKSETFDTGKFKMLIRRQSFQDLVQLREHMSGRFYEQSTVNMILRNLHASETFVDVGANNGYFSMLASKVVGSEGKVMAFEPNPEAYQRLLRNSALNSCKNLVAHNIALGAIPSAGKLKIDNINDGGSYVVTRYDHRDVIHDKNALVEGDQEIRIDTLDNLFPANIKVDMIKIDAEGYETEILRGSKRVISGNDKLNLIVEYGKASLLRRGLDYDLLLNMLNDFGFTIREILDDGLSEAITSHSQLSQTTTNLYCVR